MAEVSFSSELTYAYGMQANMIGPIIEVLTENFSVRVQIMSVNLI